MRTPAHILALMMALLAAPAHSAQTPASMQASGALIEVSIDQLAPDGVAVIGITRSTYGAGGSTQVMTGSGPAISFVEAGALTVEIVEGGPAEVVGPIDANGDGATPVDAATGSTVVIEAGSGLVLSPGVTAELRNDGPDEAVVLDVLAAADSVAEPGGGVTRTVVVSTTTTLPEPPVTATLSRVTVAPGERVALPPEPAVAVYTAVEKEQVFLISGNGFNRSTEPIDAYVLVIVPA